jgi:ABC-2 type transport system ATP-binding protein
VDDESGDRAGVRSGHPAERWFAETGDLVSEPIVDMSVEEDERIGKPLRFNHDFCLLQTVAPGEHHHGTTRRLRGLVTDVEWKLLVTPLQRVRYGQTAMAGERTSGSPVLRVSGLRRDFGDLTAVDGFNLDLAAGECVCLIGHNGSGKTTALRVAAGQLVPTSGTVTVSGADVHDRRHGHVARARLAFVPDTPVLYDDLTVGEHLELVGLAHGVSDELNERIAVLLERLGLAARHDFLPRQLSRGMRQKIQVACAFVRPFHVLLLDEPVVGLDPPSQATLRSLLIETKRGGAGVVFSTHQLAFASDLADRGMVLDGGRVVEDGPYDRVARGAEASRLGLR